MPTRCNRVFIADLIACSTCFGHHYANHQKLKSIIQWLLPVVFRAVVFKLLVWCGAQLHTRPTTWKPLQAKSLYWRVNPEDDHVVTDLYRRMYYSLNSLYIHTNVFFIYLLLTGRLLYPRHFQSSYSPSGRVFFDCTNSSYCFRSHKGSWYYFVSCCFVTARLETSNSKKSSASPEVSLMFGLVLL